MHNKSEVIDESLSLQPLDSLGVLMNRHAVNEGIFDARVDHVPVGAVVFQPAQDQRIAQEIKHGGRN